MHGLAHLGDDGCRVGALVLAAHGRVGELEVGAGVDGLVLVHVVVELEVRDDHALEAPLVTQNAGAQALAAAGPLGANVVEGAHHASAARHGLRRDGALVVRDVLHLVRGLLDGGLERTQVDLTRDLLGSPGADVLHAVGLLVVHREVLDHGVAAVLGGAAHHGSTNLAGKQRVLGVVLEVAASERRAMRVHGRRVPAVVRGGQRLLANHLAHAMHELHVPGLGHDDLRAVGAVAGGAGERGEAGGAVGLDRSGLAHGLDLRGVVGVVVQAGRHLLDGELVEDVVPGLGVKVLSAHVDELQAVVCAGSGHGGVGILVVLELPLHKLHTAVCSALVGSSLGEGSLEVLAGHGLDVLLHVLGHVVELVGDLRVGGRVGRVLLGPQRHGLLVHDGVRVGAQANDVVAGVKHVCLLVGAVGGHVAHGELNGDLLARAGVERVGLGKAAQHDSGLLEPACGVRGGVVHLDDVLACHGACVGNRDLDRDLLVIRIHGVERLRERGVREAKAKREDNGLVVVEAVVVASLGLGGCGLVVAVAIVESLGVLDEVRVARGLLGVVVLDVGVALAAEVLEGGVCCEVRCPDVGGLAGGVHGSSQHLAKRCRAGSANGAHLENCVDLVVAEDQRTKLHGRREVEHRDDLGARRLGSRDDTLLLDGELKLVLAVLVVGRLTVGGEVLRDAGLDIALEVAGEVTALATAAANKDQANGAVDGRLSVGAVVRPGNLANVVGGRGRVVHGDGGLGVVGEVAVNPVVGGVIDGEARLADALVEVDAGVGVDGTRARAAVNRVGGIAAEHTHGIGRGERQCGVVVLHEDDAFALNLGDQLVCRLGRLVATAIVRGVVLRVPALGALDLLDRRRTSAHVVVEQRAELVRRDVCGGSDAQQANRRDGRADELPSRCALSHSHSPYVPSGPEGRLFDDKGRQRVHVTPKRVASGHLFVANCSCWPAAVEGDGNASSAGVGVVHGVTGLSGTPSP